MKILFCMLSDQHVPNLLSVHHFRPERLTLIVSAEMKKKNGVDRFLGALKAGGLDYSERCDCFPLAEVSNFDVIRRSLQEAYGKHPSDEWIVNLTGGTKPMSIVAYEFFKAVGARLVYVEANRPNTLLFIEGAQEESCAHRTSIVEFVRGYGFESIKSEEKVKKAEERAMRWSKAAELIARESPDNMPFRIDDEQRGTARKKGLDLEKGMLVLPESIAGEVASIFNLQREGDSLLGKLDKHAVQFFTGGWLEVFLWSLLDRHKEALRIWDVRLGIEIGAVSGTTGNDLDICFMHEHSLCAIECKSGAQEQDKGFDVLYKVEAVIRQLRALRVRTFLATTSPSLYGEGSRIKSNIADRASVYNCQIVSKDQIQALASKPDDPDLLRRVLFEKKAS